MATFYLTIDTDTAAFCDEIGEENSTSEREELARILATIPGRLFDGEMGGILRDLNGARVGEWGFTDS